jgi:hypothetical protein
MRSKILYSLLLTLFFAACTKDKFTSKPQLSFVKFTKDVVRPGDVFQIVLEVTDKEGDIQDSIFVEKFVANCPGSGFKTRYKLPTFSEIKNLKGQLEICYGYGINLGCPIITGPFCPNKNDTAVFRFYVRDLAGNVSDTLTTPTVILTR